MKTLLTLTLLMLVCFLKLNSARPPVAIQMTKDECCTSISNKMYIPKAKVKHVAMTPTGCKSPAIIVTTVADKQLCLDPEWKHAKTHLEEFQRKSNSTSKP